VSTAVLAACGGDSENTTEESSTPGADPSGLGVFTFFDPRVLVAGAEVRAPIGIGDVDGPLSIEDSPAEITVTVTSNGDEVATETVAFRSEGLPRGYYPLRFVPPAAGLYDLVVTAAGLPELTTTIQLEEPASVAIPGPGDPFPVIDTPTVEDARGVTPICTRDTICSLHDRNLPELLLDTMPSVVLVSTPEFCSTAVCGPVLELVLAEADARPGVSMLHAEVYADPANDLATVAPIVQAMGFTFEPSVIFIDGGGTIVERLDFVFDASELSDSLDRLTA
jgi:hypothetical protein